MVRLKMMHHEIVHIPTPQPIDEVLTPLFGHPCVNSIHQRHLFIKDKVGIIGDAFRRRILALEKTKVVIVDPYIFQFGNYCSSHIFIVF